MSDQETREPSPALSMVRPGWWDWKGSRICLFDVDSELSALHWAFFDEVGTGPAHFLYLAGLRAAVALVSSLPTARNSLAFFTDALEALKTRGYGSFQITDSDAVADIIEIDATDTLEAWAYLRRQSTAPAPVCNYTRGLLAGIACIAHEPVGSPTHNIVAWETRCRSMGHEHCRFVIGPAQTLAARGHKNPDEQRAPRWSLEDLNSQLRVSTDQLREVQTQLSERQQAYENLLDNMLDPLLVLDEKQSVVFFNLRFIETTGLTGDEALRMNPLELVHQDDRPAVEEVFRDLIDGKNRSATISCRIPNRQRTTIVECSARAITGRDARPAVQVICRDITEREQARLDLESANRKLTQKQKVADNDLRLAKLVHESLLPRPLRTESVMVDVKYVPVDRVGGDYCHYTMLENRYLVLTMCDVSGHGVAAALLASRVNSHLSEKRLIDPDPWAITLDMNEFLRRSFGDTGMFVTFLAVTIDLKTFSARICGAGHPGPIHWSKIRSQTHCIPSQHLPVGILEDFHRIPHFNTIQLEAGDRLVLYTDGVTEMSTGSAQSLRISGLEKLVSQASDIPLFGLGDWILRKVTEPSPVKPHDDMTLMMVEMKTPLRSRSEYSLGTI
ncbi:SpoIIE family protein phosphatase [bacterium]|nr:SpoIIE family protein phosphatase [bacterium]